MKESHKRNRNPAYKKKNSVTGLSMRSHSETEVILHFLAIKAWKEEKERMEKVTYYGG